MQHVVILGAGISGLSLAWFLKKRFGEHLAITLIEEKAYPGGWIKTETREGFLFESGPRSLRSRGSGRKTLELIEALSIQDQVIAADSSAKKRYLFTRGKLRALPEGPFSFFTSSTTRHLAGAFLREWWISKGSSSDESIADFFSRRFNHRMMEELIDPMVSGIFAGDVNQLSMRACFPSIYSWEQEYGSVVKGALFGSKQKGLPASLIPFVAQMDKAPIFSFKGGLQTLTDALALPLVSHLRLSTVVKSVKYLPAGIEVEIESEGGLKRETLFADHLFSTIPAYRLASCLCESGENAGLRPLLNSIEAVSVASVHVGYRRSVLEQKGFGYLIPSREKESVLGVVFDSSVFPEQNYSPEETRLTVMMGGVRGVRGLGASLGNKELNRGELEKCALEALFRHLGIRAEPDVIFTTVAGQAIPQYNVGYLERVEKIKEILLERFPRLTVTGNYFEGVSVNECIAKSFEIAERFTGFLKQI